MGNRQPFKYLLGGTLKVKSKALRVTYKTLLINTISARLIKEKINVIFCKQ